MESVQAASKASPKLGSATTAQRNSALQALKKGLQENKQTLFDANAEDRADALKAVQAGTLDENLYKRLDCTGDKFTDLLTGLDDVIALNDPVGNCTMARQLADDLELFRVTCPIGVLLIIFESRPDACVQILSLALKSGNCVILKGGKEAKKSLHAIHSIVTAALKGCEGIPEGCVQMCDTREDVAALLKMDQYIDLVVPRGSNSLVRYIKNNTTIPVLGHADGLCIGYVDREVNVDAAVNVVEDSKLQYVAACNALETVIVHKDVAAEFLSKMSKKLSSKSVQYRADERSLPMLPKEATTAATETDFKTEWLNPTMTVKIVDTVDEAVDHINTHSSHHTDIILSTNQETIDYFMRNVDSAGVYVNCSTRFADGFRYGFGAEVGISTNRVHARGPVGLDELVIYKYRIYGKGQCVGQFSSAGIEGLPKLQYNCKPISIDEVKNVDMIQKRQQKFFA